MLKKIGVALMVCALCISCGGGDDPVSPADVAGNYFLENGTVNNVVPAGWLDLLPIDPGAFPPAPNDNDFIMNLLQTGATVTGTFRFYGQTFTVTGTVSGTTFTFTLRNSTIVPLCQITITGSGRVNTGAGTITVSAFSGSSCVGGQTFSGSFTARM